MAADKVCFISNNFKLVHSSNILFISEMPENNNNIKGNLLSKKINSGLDRRRLR